MPAKVRVILVAYAALLTTANVQGQPLRDIHGDPLPAGAIGRFGTIRLRHHAYISEMAVLPDGKTLASLDEGGGLLLSHLQSGGEHRYMRLTADGGCRSTLSPDRRLVATTDGKQIGIYELNTGKLLHGKKIGSASLGAKDGTLCFSGDGRVLATTSWDGKHVDLWDTTTGSKRGRLAFGKEPGTGAFLAASPDGKLLVGSNGSGSFRVWELPGGKWLYDFPSRVTASGIVFSPDSKWLVQAFGDRETRVILRDTAIGEEVHCLDQPVGVTRLTFAPSSPLLAIGRYDGQLCVVDTERVKTVATLRPPRGARAVADCCFSSDGRHVLTANWTDSYKDAILEIREFSSGKQVFRATVTDVVSTDNFRCALTPDCTGVLAACGHGMRLWDVPSGKERAASPGPFSAVHGIGTSPDGRQIATMTDEGHTSVWDRQTQRQRLRIPTLGLPWINPVFGVEGKSLVVSCDLGDAVAVWSVECNVKMLRRTSIPQYRTARLAPDGRLVAWENDETIALMDLATGKEHARLPSLEKDVVVASFSPDGQRLAAMVSSGGLCSPVLVWDLIRYRQLPKLVCTQFDPGGRPEFSPDGRLLARVGHADEVRGLQVCIWEAATGRHCLRVSFPAKSAYALAFAPDGKTLAIGSADGSFRLLECATGKVLRTFTGHRGAIHGLRFSPDSELLYTASDDTTVLMWDMKRPPAKFGTKAKFKTTWADLAGEDAEKAYRAVWAFVAAPEQAATFLGAHLKPIAPRDNDGVQRLIADLESDNFATRDVANARLVQLGEGVELALREGLNKVTSLEARRRREQLLAAMPIMLPPLKAEELRQVRAVQALELIGTAEARAVLQRLAKGAAHARQTREALETLDRFSKRADAGR
jgi:WD40 repeat protein